MSKQEKDALVDAGGACLRTAQVWLQEVLLAPPKDHHVLEPSGEERTRMHVLLSDVAAAATQARCDPSSLLVYTCR